MLNFRRNCLKIYYIYFKYVINCQFLISRNTTHVVFKDGLISTYQKARNWNIPIVSILWVEACRKYVCLMDPREYVISNVERYEQPELYQKMRVNKKKQIFF